MSGISDSERDAIVAEAEAARDALPGPAAARRRTQPRDPSALLSVRVPVAMIEALRVFAAGRGTTSSALLREWIVDRLDAEAAGLEPQADQLRATASFLAGVAKTLDDAADRAHLAAG